MPKVSSVPRWLRVFLSHGVELSWGGGSQARGDCPFCSKPKFYVGLEDGRWDCKTCHETGNPTTFLRTLWEKGENSTKEEAYRELAADRKLLNWQTLDKWQFVQSPLTGEWLIPGYAPDGGMNQLYRYVDGGKGKRRLWATPEIGHYLHGINLWDEKKSTVYICEGPFDAMCLWEVLRVAKAVEGAEGELVPTKDEKRSLYADANVIAVPGAGVWSESWLPFLSGKRVVILFDNDHPVANKQTGQVQNGSGYLGTKRLVKLLAGVKEGEGPSEVLWLKWGEKGYDEGKPNGYDLRDHLSAGPHLKDRLERLEEILFAHVEAPPQEWVEEGKEEALARAGQGQMSCLDCSAWKDLVRAWEKALHWTEGLDRALSVMLASVTSVKSVGDQLWVKIVSPPSTGKSVLCEALSVARKYVVAKSTLKGFYSGYQTDKEGTEDQSLIVKLMDKTLVTKDGDTLLTLPNKEQILSQARDLYDGTAQTQYNNMMSRNYCGIRMTWILCGTSSLRQLDASEFGERTLDCVIMDTIDTELEDEILWRVANRADRCLNQESNGKLETQYDPDMATAMRLTGGYVNYLRENANKLLNGVEFSDEAKRKCIHLGKFVAYMRARPSKKQDEEVNREFAARLVSQMVRLAKCLAAVLNRTEIDGEVMRRVASVARDTARGRTLDMVKILYVDEGGLELRSLAHKTEQDPKKEVPLLYFLRKLGVVETHRKSLGTSGVMGNVLWRLTPLMRKLYTEVYGDES